MAARKKTNRQNYIEKLSEISHKIGELSYQDIKTKYGATFDEKLASLINSYGNFSVEERLAKKPIDADKKAKLESVILKLKTQNATFVPGDIENLEVFTSSIDSTVNHNQYISNIKNGESRYLQGRLRESHILDIVLLFNEIKKHKTLAQFLSETTIGLAFTTQGNFKSFLTVLFVICKNCENPTEYPLFYKFYQGISKWCFNQNRGDYDSFTTLYKNTTIEDDPKAIAFDAYYHFLALEIKKELESLNLTETIQDRNFLENEIFNYDDASFKFSDNTLLEVQNKFKAWLKENSPSSADNYFSAFNSVNKISESAELGNLYKWTEEDWIEKEPLLRAYREFNEKNAKGHNRLTASIGQFKNFLSQEDMQEIQIPPRIPFTSFGWRWATTGISSKLNLPVSLFAVLDAIVINGSGQPNKTQEFKNLLRTLCVNKYEIADADLIKTLTREDKADINKNIIENSGNYWRHINLIDPSGGNAVVTDFGKSFLTGRISKDEFIETLIHSYKLPSPVYNAGEAEEFVANDIEIFPFKILLDVFEELHKRGINEEDRFLSEEDLKKIIVPFSVQYSVNHVGKLVDHVLNNRLSSADYANWPNCYSHYTDDKGERMINEYLYFLEAFEFLRSNLGIENVRGNAKKYYATEKLIKLFLESAIANGSLEALPAESTSTLKKAENKIYFGAPGTGKSFKVDKIIAEIDKKYWERITFHPDFDYSSFVGGYKPVSTDESIAYRFVPQAFTLIYEKAWCDLANQYYLIIEEINRGNCAEIFGDIFQLLDRNSNYTVTPSEELKKYLSDKLGSEHEGLINGLKLPPNLSLLATMNTSDQSLFPMDSAFKRRWDWEYVPINLSRGDANESSQYFVKIEDAKFFSWIDFIEKVNENIAGNRNLGLDKCLGNYFIKASENNVINLEDFIHKVIFYLWNDVFKDEPINSIFKDNINYQKFFPIEKDGKENVLQLLVDLKVSFDFKEPKFSV